MKAHFSNAHTVSLLHDLNTIANGVEERGRRKQKVCINSGIGDSQIDALTLFNFLQLSSQLLKIRQIGTGFCFADIAVASLDLCVQLK